MVVDLERNEGYNFMGRYTGSVCKRCRREGVKLFLKGERCQSGKCSLERRNHPPGMHNWRKGKLSEYGLRLREKQKVKRYYGLYEGQFFSYFERASHTKGNTGENLLVLLERRLDNVVCRGGLANSRAQARQFIVHGHVWVNGKKLDIPSYLVRANDVITVAPGESSQKMIHPIYESFAKELPSWLERASDKMEVKVVNMPVRSEIEIEVKEQLIVEVCSR
jgi:small subunit ribosomal protein S4